MTLIQKTKSKSPLISIYLSRVASPYAGRSFSIRWVHLLKEARRQLQSELSEEAIEVLMGPLWKMNIEDTLGKGNMSLAVFHGKEGTDLLRIPSDVEDRCIVARSFHIKPVLYWVQSDPQFYILALGSNLVKLYRGSASGIECVREIHSSRAQTESKRLSARSPQSNREYRKADTMRFFQEVEQQIRLVIGKDRHPVIVAGVKSLIPIYRKVNKDPDLVSEFVQGSPHHWSEQDLQVKSAEILRKLFESAKNQAVSEYESAEPLGTATTQLEKIVEAANQGRIQKLLVAYDMNMWGSFDANPPRIRLHAQKISSSEDDILDDLAELVLSKGGKVLTLPLAQMPHLEPAAAILR